jgi:hypothetical protein
MRLSHVVIFVSAASAGLASAETKSSDCGTLVAMLEAAVGYNLTATPSVGTDGWCTLDSATMKAKTPDLPDISVKRLRLRGTEADGGLTSLSIDLTGAKVTPKVTDTAMDGRLRSLFRLQTAELRITATRDEAEDQLELRDGLLRLSGGTEVEFSADLGRARLSAASIMTGALTMLDLKWKNDGRLLRPAMEAVGEALTEDTSATARVDAARSALSKLSEALPAASLAGETAEELDRLIAAIPQGRGRLTLRFSSEDGIGAAELALVALSADPSSPAALARLLAGSTVSADWLPGIAP